VFWTVIPFGTGGPARPHVPHRLATPINDRTIGESAQGLADYVKEHRREGGRRAFLCHRLRHADQLAAFRRIVRGHHGRGRIPVYFLDDYRSTPELSFLVRYKQCSCGIMVTASHNPPSDNAVKVYWSTGGQVLPPHDQAIIDRVMNVQEIRLRRFSNGVADGRVVICTQEVDAAFVQAVVSQRRPGPRDLK
jgi:phosphomannomutase